MKTFATVVSCGALGLALVTIPGTASAATSYKACVKKSTGEARMLVGKAKKCKKGWKKVTWSKAGPQGGQGAAGAPGATGGASYLGVVVDGSGAVVGKAMGSFTPTPALGALGVKIDDGLWTFLTNGWLSPLGSPAFTDPACSAAPFVPASDALELAEVSGSPAFRLVYRTTSGDTLGPARGYKLTGTSSTLVNTKTYRWDDAGACIVDSASFTGYRVDLIEVTAPADRPAPLRIQ